MLDITEAHISGFIEDATDRCQSNEEITVELAHALACMTCHKRLGKGMTLEQYVALHMNTIDSYYEEHRELLGDVPVSACRGTSSSTIKG
jgi:hypothetical protein